MIKLLALDLDGTLLSSRGELSEQNVAAIRAAEELGVLVTIATGRRFRDARPTALKLNLNAPIITHNGALIKRAESFEVVNAALISQTAAREVLRIGREFGSDAMLSIDPNGKGGMLYDNIAADNVQLQSYVNWARRIHGDEADEAIRHVRSLEAVLPEVHAVQLAFSGTCAQMQSLKDKLLAEIGDGIQILETIYTRQNFTLLDILHPEASKGYALRKLAERNNLTAENVMAMGDNYNDLEMLDYAGTPVIMGNADPLLYENERYNKTLSNDESGVALAIERFILGA